MPSGFVAVLARQLLLENLRAESEQCQDLCWEWRKRRDPQHRGSQAGFLPEDVLVQAEQQAGRWPWEGTQAPAHLTR